MKEPRFGGVFFGGLRAPNRRQAGSHKISAIPVGAGLPAIGPAQTPQTARFSGLSHNLLKILKKTLAQKSECP
jgi:hypothetical protein